MKILHIGLSSEFRILGLALSCAISTPQHKYTKRPAIAMRLSLRARGQSRSSPRLSASLAALALLAPAASRAVEFDPAPPANLDFSNLGRVGIAGDFNGISLYEYEGQSGRSSSRNGSESVLAMLPNGALASIINTDATIRSMCTFKLSNGEMQGIILGGNFTSLDGTQSTAMALLNPETGEITPLDGLEGEVSAVLCDEERETVYVGGNFKGADSTNAIAWNGTDGWTNLPFAGFNGPVEAISKASNGHIIFGGSFTGLGNTSAPSEPDGQTINLGTAKISGVNSMSGADGDPKNIACPSGSDGSKGTWLVQDNSPGIYDAEFGFGFEPTKLRLWNTHQEDRGTKTFRYIALPDGGIMNLTYVDPSTKKNMSCTSECPLSDDKDIEFQDFHFVNRVGMNRFQLAISSWYGSGAGLSGIELFQDNIFSYAIGSFNEPACGSVDFPSNATSTGPWKESPSLQSSSNYLMADVAGGADADATSVVFLPNIRESGNYSVNMYTPGCQPDGSCSQRGRVNVTGTMSSSQGEADFSTTLYQTNDYDKYDQIYFGYIDKTSDDFQPSVTLRPLPDDSGDSQTVVAMRVGFTLINSTGGLNGLFEYDPEAKEVDLSKFEDSAINKLGASFDRNTGVKSLVSSDEITFVGGNFTSEEHVNIVAIGSDNKVQALDGGLNGQVLSMHVEESTLFVGGEFTSTRSGDAKGLSHAAYYDSSADSWSPLGAGVDGNVENVVPIQLNITDDGPESAIALSGSFSQINEFDDYEAISVDGFAIWVVSQENWLQNLNGSLPTYAGVLTAAVRDVPDMDPIYAGSMSSSQVGANGIAMLDDEGLTRMAVDIEEPSRNSSAERRDLMPTEDVSGVVTGIFYDDDGKNLTILAGRFSIQSGKDTITSLAVIDGDNEDAISGPGSEISSDSVIVTLDVTGNTLFAGGRISGTINENQISGIIAYDISDKTFGTQPAAVSGGNATVSTISVRPDSTDVFVGGSFTKAGGLDCPGLCLYSSESSQWTRPGSDISGAVHSLMWQDKKSLIVGGDLTYRGKTRTPLAIYNPKKETWDTYPNTGADSIPGTLQVLTPASADNKQLWVAGVSNDDESVFISKYDGDSWHSVDHPLTSETVIQSLQVFTVTENHDSSDLLDKDQVLLITGSIGLPDFGTASAAIYNGTNFLPYAITSKEDSGTGSISRIFTQKDNFFASSEKHMALVFVVLIALAIALGIILLIVAGGILLDRIRKRREGYSPAPTSMYDRGSGMHRIPPQELLESLGKGRSGAPHI